nr:hypothetical protein [Streptomyces albus]
MARGTVFAASLVLVPLVTACGGGADDAAVTSGSAKTTGASEAVFVAPAKVEVIAGLTGCKAKIRLEADELRQGVCHTPEVDYLITTFPKEEHQRAWLDSAAVYGGEYLVGSRWIVSAKKPEMLEEFRAKLGGTVQELRGGRGPASAPGTP